jgi:TPR repeat protein
MRCVSDIVPLLLVNIGALAAVLPAHAVPAPAPSQQPADIELRASCEAGNMNDCERLGHAILSHAGRTSADVDKALALFQRACDGKIETACFSLASAYMDGQTIKPDPARAAKLFE